MAVIGDLSELPKEATFEWKIKDILTLSEKTEYASQEFYFSGASWSLFVCPYGREKEDSGWISLYLQRETGGIPIQVNIKLGVRMAHGETLWIKDLTEEFEKSDYSIGFSKLTKRKTLMKIKSQLIPENGLTIVCKLQSNKPSLATYSYFNRLTEICDNLRSLLKSSKGSDVRLKLRGKIVPSHRIILESRSPVFAAMLRQASTGKQMTEISIDDVDPIIMMNIIMFLYYGDLNDLTQENAIAYYAAADKFEIKYIKELCCNFILRNLSVDWVCDVIQFADTYQENEILQRAVEYFKENAVEILNSEKWRIFAIENPQLLYLFKESSDKRKSSTKEENVNRDYRSKSK